MPLDALDEEAHHLVPLPPEAAVLDVLVLCLALSAQESAPPTQEAFLVLGIRQYGDGDYESAVFTLDSAVRKLTGSPGKVRDLVSAYVYLGAVYVGLDHEDVAKGKFQKALALDPSVRLSAEQFPPRVLQVFETQVLKATVAQKKRGAKVFLILGGLGAAGAVGVVAATKQSGRPIDPPRPPSARRPKACRWRGSPRSPSPPPPRTRMGMP